jgi:hypothetical protein
MIKEYTSSVQSEWKKELKLPDIDPNDKELLDVLMECELICKEVQEVPNNIPKSSDFKLDENDEKIIQDMVESELESEYDEESDEEFDDDDDIGVILSRHDVDFLKATDSNAVESEAPTIKQKRTIPEEFYLNEDQQNYHKNRTEKLLNENQL